MGLHPIANDGREIIEDWGIAAVAGHRYCRMAHVIADHLIDGDAKGNGNPAKERQVYFAGRHWCLRSQIGGHAEHAKTRVLGLV